ncbi:hypothetical protein GCM10011369_23030 [Neiella marina]|uniref:Uncharacterized protein n=1 Tax=Neiella marina TaxID=508461 RepID=A0A8J2U5W9_9GAMM|nr:hypothetical protein [Neiella marina]GGA80498.1 hypothetical protein GCM10011369_23030 [Neiella marina]
MKRIQIALISGLTLATSVVAPAASADELTGVVSEVAMDVAEQVAADIRESSVRQLEQVWANLQSVIVDTAKSE